jgi:uncharacterized protein involved in outer membrane biogenesis
VSTVLKSPQEDRPGFHLPEVHLPHVDWRGLNPFAAVEHGGDGGGEPPRKPWRPGWSWAVGGAAVLAVVLFLALFQWNWLRGPIGRYASTQTGRTVTLRGDLKVHLLTLTPRVDIGGLTIANPAWAPKETMADVGNVAVSAKLLPLLSGRVVLPLVSLQHPDVALFRDAQGRANWDFSNGRKSAKPFKLPPIQNFVIDQGQMRLNDLGRKLTFVGTINANEQRTAAYDRGFHLTGKGELNRRTFSTNVVGGPLINVQADRPYPFDADIHAGSTHITAKGQVPRPFNLGVLNAAVAVEGVDLNDLYDLTGLALPNTPPYRIAGRFRRDGSLYHYDRFSGRVGRSDLSGDATVEMATGRPFLKAKLHSRLLDFADLGSLFGVPGASAAAAPGQKAQARALAAQGRFLPDNTLQTERIRGMDAVVTYTAAQVRAPDLPLRTVSLGVKLDHGVLRLDPISLSFPSGQMTGQARIDARKAVPFSDVDLRFGNIRLEEFFHAADGSRPLQGTLLARAKLAGPGNSVHRAAARSNGAVTVVIPQGQIRQAFAELMGIDATKGLFLLLAKDQQPTEIRCALADFNVREGVLYAQRIVFDTGVVLVSGSGTVNLDTEAMNLEFKGKPKKLRAVRLVAPITVQGRLRAPKVGIEAGAVVAQAGIGAVLGSVLSPLAAILPFVSPGLEKDANCAGLLAEARTSEAPVKAAASSTTPVKGKGG